MKRQQLAVIGLLFWLLVPLVAFSQHAPASVMIGLGVLTLVILIRIGVTTGKR